MDISKKTRTSCKRQDTYTPPHLFSGVLFLIIFLIIPHTKAIAQRLSLRTNTLEWVAASPNLGVEFTLNKHLTTEFSASVSPYKVSDKLYLDHYRLQPELKYWFENALVHHYIGVTAFYSSFDLGIKSKAFYGDAYAAGITYGYNWLLSRRWNLELSAGIGAIHYRMARYTPGEPHPEPDQSGWIPAPVKLGVSFIYVIK